MRAVEHLTDDKDFNHSFLKTLILDAIEEVYLHFEGTEKEPKNIELVSGFYDKVKEEIELMLDNPNEQLHLNIRFCSQCKKVMKSGYVINSGEEYYCSQECLAEVYTAIEFDTILAGLDHTNEEDLEEVRNMSNSQFETYALENNDSYWTEWEWE